MRLKLRFGAGGRSAFFNAGKGSYFTSAGTNEMMPAMWGKNLAPGAVAQIEHVRNPIVLARPSGNPST